jgi:hypothetical protein
MDELDLFGIRGGPASVIHVMADELQKCKAVLEVGVDCCSVFGAGLPDLWLKFTNTCK